MAMWAWSYVCTVCFNYHKLGQLIDFPPLNLWHSVELKCHTLVHAIIQAETSSYTTALMMHTYLLAVHVSCTQAK